MAENPSGTTGKREPLRSNDLLCCDSAAKLKAIVAEQAEDEGLWFNAVTVPEAYLQQELRKLHAVVEREFGET